MRSPLRAFTKRFALHRPRLLIVRFFMIDWIKMAPEIPTAIGQVKEGEAEQVELTWSPLLSSLGLDRHAASA